MDKVNFDNFSYHGLVSPPQNILLLLLKNMKARKINVKRLCILMIYVIYFIFSEHRQALNIYHLRNTVISISVNLN